MKRTERHPPAADREKGRLITTAAGTTYAEYLPGDRPETFVFVHGFSIPSGVWEKNFYFLSRCGYGVLRYDLFGRGFSRTPARTHTLALYAAQLAELLAALHPPGPAVFVGLSMGGAIVNRFRADQPAAVSGLCLIAPIVRQALSGLNGWLRLPGIGEFTLRFLARRIIKTNIDRNMPVGAGDPDFRAAWLAQADEPAFRAALLSSARHLVSRPETYAYRPLGRACLIWGESDPVMPFRFAEIVRRALGSCEFHPLAGVGHAAPWERPDEVNRILLEFMRDI
jgi:pimeloyl-ACP methyl ester carboxylesterase